MKFFTGCAAAVVLASLAISGSAPTLSAQTCCDKAKRVEVRRDGDKVLRVSGFPGKDLEDVSGAWLGVRLQELTPGLREALDIGDGDGVLVSDVIEDSPAEKAGIKPGDVIVKMDDREVEDSADVIQYVRKRDPGTEIRIDFLREGKKGSENVKLGEREADTVRILSGDEDAPSVHAFSFSGPPRIGVVVQPMDENLAGYFDVKEDEGVLVVRVMEDSPAEEAGIKSGDVIVEVAGKKVRQAEDIREAVGDREAGDEIALRIIRKGKDRDIQVTLDENSHAWFSGSDLPGPNMKWLPDVPALRKHMRPLRDSDDEDLSGELDRMKEEILELRQEMQKLKEGRS